MPTDPPSTHFEHHGVPVETREQWLARQAAEAAARAAAEAQRRAEADAQRRAALAEAGRKAAEEAARKESERRARVAEEARIRATSEAQTSSSEISLIAEVRSGASRRRGTLIAAAGLALSFSGGVYALRETSAKPEVDEVDSTTTTTGQEATLMTLPPSPPPTSPSPPPAPDPRPTKSLASPYGGGATAATTPDWADAPSINPAPGGWWCICYRTVYGAPHTACRRQVGECEALRAMIEGQGTSAILRGSASPGACVYIAARYPWLKVGHKSKWAPSAYPEATQAPDICAL